MKNNAKIEINDLSPVKEMEILEEQKVIGGNIFTSDSSLSLQLNNLTTQRQAVSSEISFIESLFQSNLGSTFRGLF